MSPGNVPRNAAHRAPRRRPHPVSRKRPRRKPLSWKQRVAVGAGVAVFALLMWAAIARSLAPASNTSRTRFDAIIVLGTSADSDGNPRPDQLARVTEAVHEYQRGMAPRLILSGGAAHNKFVEARVMARSAEALGIPESAVFIEPEAMDTIQNACYSVRIMKAHGWHSAEIISRAEHLPRASLIFSSLAQGSWPLEWSEHAAPPLSPESSAYHSALTTVEVLKTARYLVWARWLDQCQP